MSAVARFREYGHEMLRAWRAAMASGGDTKRRLYRIRRARRDALLAFTGAARIVRCERERIGAL